MSMPKTPYLGHNIIGPENYYNYVDRNHDNDVTEAVSVNQGMIDMTVAALHLGATYVASKDVTTGAWTETITKDGATLATKVSTPNETGWVITINAPNYGLSKTMTYTKDINNNWNLQVVNN